MVEEIGNNNPSETRGAPSESFANIPAPTAEIKVRTMRSDLASLAARGGGLPRFEKVNVEGLSISRATAPTSELKRTSNPIVPIIIFVIVIIILGAAGWFGYSILFKNNSAGQNATSTAASGVSSDSVSNVSPVAVYQPTSTVMVPMASTTFIHASLFKKPVDQVVAFSISSGSAVQTADELQTYNQQLGTALSGASKSANFIEIDVKGADGHDLSIEELLSEANAEILNSNFLTAHFNPDATFFAYQDAKGFWPGYVIALNIGESQGALESDIQAIESSPSIENMFLTSVGTSTPSGFTDAVISSASVRILNFSGVVPAAFVYGFFQNDLIISTSRAGFAAAVARLQ